MSARVRYMLTPAGAAAVGPPSPDGPDLAGEACYGLTDAGHAALDTWPASRTSPQALSWVTRRKRPGSRRVCPGGCRKNVALHSGSGRISSHDDPRTGLLCIAATKTLAEIAAEAAARRGGAR